MRFPIRLLTACCAVFAAGRCTYTPREGNLVLVVAHLVKPDETGDGYDKTAYAATLVIDVPERCTCCAAD